MASGAILHDFRFPWEFDSETSRPIHPDTTTQLELSESRCSAPCAYEAIFEPKTHNLRTLFSRMGEAVSNGPVTINAQRAIVKNVTREGPLLTPAVCSAIDTLRKNCEDIHEDEGFRTKYGYIDFERIASLNEIPLVMVLLVMYNVGSPLFSLLSPVVGALLAYIVLIIRGMQVSITTFVSVLSQRLRWLFDIKKLFSKDITFFTRTKVILTAGLYCLSIYQNIKSCRSFVRNYSVVGETFDSLITVSDAITDNLQRIIATDASGCAPTREYWEEATVLTSPARQLADIIRPYAPLRFTSPSTIPLALRMFYKFKHCQYLRTALRWLLGVAGLCDAYDGLARGWRSGKLGAYLCTDSFDSAFVRDLRHPTLGHDCVANTLRMRESIVLTGRNGSGKTTLAKSLAIAAIVGSQFGLSPCSKAQMPPLATIRCEMNVPDTNERDSLFEAEGRRCLELIDVVQQDPEAHHLCIFDELFSGTNAAEALEAATGVLTNLSRSYKVRFLVTTHMHDLGPRLGSDIAQCLTMTTTKSNAPTHLAEQGVAKSSGAHDTLMRIGFTSEQLQVKPENNGARTDDEDTFIDSRG
jgi:hypothetical protein